jgi:hypothetical protein
MGGYTASGRARRLETSHPERAWKMRECPACGAQPGEWCRLPHGAGHVYVTAVHQARVPTSAEAA